MSSIRIFSRLQKVAGVRAIGTQRLTRNERKISNAFQSAIREVTAGLDRPESRPELIRALVSGDASQVVSTFNWAGFGERFSENRAVMLSQVQQSGAAEANVISNVFGRMSFDMTDSRAASWAASTAGRDVVQISVQLQNDIRNLVTNSFVNQIDPREIAGELSRKIGLFDRWATAVENQYQRNFNSFLSEGWNRSEAAEMARGLADRYRDRLIRVRSENIARTEVMSSANQGRYISWLQAGDQGVVNLDRMWKEWIAEADACEDCAEVDEETVPVMDSFSNGEDMPPFHPSCRCTAVMIDEADVDPSVVAEYGSQPADTSTDLSSSTNDTSSDNALSE